MWEQTSRGAAAGIQPMQFNQKGGRMILITGATGKVGKELVLDLSERRSAFKVMVRSESS